MSTPTPTVQEEKNVYELFRISIILKGLVSVAEVLAGVIILFIPPAVVILAANELIEPLSLLGAPGAWLAVHLGTVVGEFTHGTAIFVSIYLLSRGIVKSFLIWALLRNKPWAYPVSLLVLGMFVLYQLYQIVVTHSVLVVGITLFDLVVLYFIWREYQIQRIKNS